MSGGGRTEEARLRGCLASFTLGQAWGQGRDCCTGLWANRLPPRPCGQFVSGPAATLTKQQPDGGGTGYPGYQPE